MKSNKRKLSETDYDNFAITKTCCRNLSVFACICAIISLLVHTYWFSNLDNRLDDKIKEYMTKMTGSTSHRLKREAMLVSLVNLILTTIISSR